MTNNIKSIREGLGMSQQQLANLIGSSKPYISDLETGKRDISRIQFATMQRLCKVLNATPEQIAGVTVEFSEDGRMIVDGFWYVLSLRSYMIQIGGLFYRLPQNSFLLSGKQLAEKMECLPTGIMYTSKATDCWKDITHYAFAKVSPRDNSFLNAWYKDHRPAAKDELEEAKAKYGITDWTDEFDHVLGAVGGNAFRRTITSIQLAVPSGVNPITVAEWFLNRGIYAGAASPSRVNVRVR